MVVKPIKYIIPLQWILVLHHLTTLVYQGNRIQNLLQFHQMAGIQTKRMIWQERAIFHLYNYEQ